MSEVNDYYTRTKPKLAEFSPVSVSEAAANAAPSGFGRNLLWIYGMAIRLRKWLPWIFVPMLFVAALLEIAFLKLVLIFRPGDCGPTHQHARSIVAELVEQYPFGSYAVVWKALQLAFLRTQLPWDEMKRVVEAAIGEGTFSERVFMDRISVAGLDINPVSLKKASELSHVHTAVVCDCTDPPLLPGSIDLLISNNFLHHVTDKRRVLENWSRAARFVAFNDCTPAWSRALPPSWILTRIGLKALAERVAGVVDALGAQSLMPRNELEAIISDNLEVTQSAGFFSERTYCIANVQSLLCLHMGPVPEEIKQCLLHPWLRRLSTNITRHLCDLLIQFDSREDRRSDVVLCYIGKSKSTPGMRSEAWLKCVCGSGLEQLGRCADCGRENNHIDGMWFVLADELRHVEANYDPRQAAAVPREHL